MINFLINYTKRVFEKGKTLKNLIKSINNNQDLFRNITFLSYVQYLNNYLFPIIILPYVLRVIGPINYGSVSLALAVISYLNVIVDYGFNLGAVREVSLNRENHKKLGEIFLSVIFSKMILFSVAVLSFILLVNFIPFLRKDIKIYIILFSYLIGTLIYPLWFFQGIENTKPLLYINFYSRLIGIFFIFYLIKKPEDYVIYLVILSSVQLVIGIISFIYAIKFLSVRFHLPEFNQVIHQLKENWNLFTSNIAILLYTNTNILILGIISDLNSVGIYSAADKIRLAIQGIFAPISQSVFPKVNYLLKTSFSRFLNFNKKFLLLFSSVAFIVSIFTFLFSEKIIILAFGNQFYSSIVVLKILCWIPFVVSISNVYGIQVLLSLKKDKKFLMIVFSAACISIILGIILTLLFKETGMAINYLIVEIYVSAMTFYFFKKIQVKNEI